MNAVENLVREHQYYEEYANKLAGMIGKILKDDNTKSSMSVLLYREAAELYAEFTGECGEQVVAPEQNRPA